MLRVHVHASFSCCMSMPMLQMSMSMLHVSMSMLHVHVHVHAACLCPCWTWARAQTQTSTRCIPTGLIASLAQISPTIAISSSCLMLLYANLKCGGSCSMGIENVAGAALLFLRRWVKNKFSIRYSNVHRTLLPHFWRRLEQIRGRDILEKFNIGRASAKARA